MEEEIRDNVDNREWSEKHLEAAGRLPKPSIAALTPPQLDQVDVDVRGPDGYTPLMIASFCGSRAQRLQSAAGPDSDSTGSTDLDTEDTAVIISDLINQGAAVNATTDRTGQFSRCSGVARNFRQGVRRSVAFLPIAIILC